MKFAPEYVACVLNENFEDAKTQFLSPLMAIHYAHLVMLAEQGIVPRDEARRIRDALDTIDLDEVRRVSYDGTYEDLFFYVERLIVAACGEDAAGRLHTARSRNDIDMTMYRMQQRERILALIDGTAQLRAVLLDLAGRHREDVFAAHTHTQPAQPSTIAHYLMAVVEQLERDAVRLRAAYASTNRNPLGACAITGTGFPIDRVRTSALLGFDAPTGNTYGSIATVDYLLESVSATVDARGRSRPGGAGPAAVVHVRVRLSAARRRLRAVQQHHAAEAESGRARTRARDLQQSARPGPARSSSQSTTRRSATSSTPRTIFSRWCSRCSTMRCARCGWSRLRSAAPSSIGSVWPSGRGRAGSR